MYGPWYFWIFLDKPSLLKSMALGILGYFLINLVCSEVWPFVFLDIS